MRQRHYLVGRVYKYVQLGYLSCSLAWFKGKGQGMTVASAGLKPGMRSSVLSLFAIPLGEREFASGRGRGESCEGEPSITGVFDVGVCRFVRGFGPASLRLLTLVWSHLPTDSCSGFGPFGAAGHRQVVSGVKLPGLARARHRKFQRGAMGVDLIINPRWRIYLGPRGDWADLMRLVRQRPSTAADDGDGDVLLARWDWLARCCASSDQSGGLHV